LRLVHYDSRQLFLHVGEAPLPFVEVRQAVANEVPVLGNQKRGAVLEGLPELLLCQRESTFSEEDFPNGHFRLRKNPGPLDGLAVAVQRLPRLRLVAILLQGLGLLIEDPCFFAGRFRLSGHGDAHARAQEDRGPQPQRLTFH
jgi:hypothetical protein